MLLINAQNVNDALVHGRRLLDFDGIEQTSRNGPVVIAPDSVTTRYHFPTQRVLMCPARDANPFFHLMEALWMLGGQRDVRRMAELLPRMADFSDDGESFHAAYGHRWRNWNPSWDSDQLDDLVSLLMQDPYSRRAVLGIWDPERDLLDAPAGAKDLPCNVAVKFKVDRNINGEFRLNMIVFNRSNDVLWGAYGANAVQFSMLQEYLAARARMVVGYYDQISTDYHAYLATWQPYLSKLQAHGLLHATPSNPYMTYPLKIQRLVDNPGTFDRELLQALSEWQLNRLHLADFTGFDNQFFHRIAQPMYRAFRCHKGGDPIAGSAYLMEAQNMLGSGNNNDWLTAGREWLMRRARHQQERLMEHGPDFQTPAPYASQ